MSPSSAVTRIGAGVYRIEQDGRAQVVYVAGTVDDQWVFWNGHIFRGPFATDARPRTRPSSADAHQSLTAPMPATVLKVLVERGTSVRKGDTLVILEAMKMELPVRSTADAVIRAVLCREGELVQHGAVLVELE